MFIEVFLAVFVASLVFFFNWALKRKNYWKDRNVPYVESPLLLGNVYKTFFMKKVITKAFDEIYYHPNSKGQPYVGINVFYKPAIFIRDPDLIKQIMVKDFNYFSQRHTRAPVSVDPISGLNLFQAANPLWRTLRVKLSPIFTSGKMKQMFYMVEKIGEVLNHELKKKIKTSPIIEMRTLMAGFTIDSIALVAFATEANCLKDDEMSEFKRVVITSLTSNYFNKLAVTSVFFFKEAIKLLRLTVFSSDFNKFVEKLFGEVMEERQKSGAGRNDLIDALLALKKAEVGNKDTGGYYHHLISWLTTSTYMITSHDDSAILFIYISFYPYFF